jgi:branched-chain amino acid transport system ATP-binding protein
MAVFELRPMAAGAAPAASSCADALELHGVAVDYRGARALRGLSLSVPPGAAVALLGANGAGKTTTIRAITGMLGLYNGAVTAGRISLAGDELTALGSHEIVARGVATVPEGRMIFANLTVEENLRVGAGGRRSPAIETVLELFPVLRRRLRDRGGLLSGGEQQMLAIGRALMAQPRLLLLDEVSLGLAPLITRTIFERLAEVRREARTGMLMVEQNAKLALEFCDYAYVVEHGRVVHEGPADELRSDPQVQELYLGGAPGEHARSFARAKRYRRRRRWLA